MFISCENDHFFEANLDLWKLVQGRHNHFALNFHDASAYCHLSLDRRIVYLTAFSTS